jgi:maleate cis-trans isomerase
MSERDLMGEAAYRAGLLLHKAKTRMNEVVSMGPNKVRLSPRDFRRRMKNATPDELRMLMNSLGAEEAMKLYLGRQRPVPGALEDLTGEGQ